MFKSEHNAVMDRALKTWGHRQQVIKAVEEMSELSKALCKWLNLDVPVRNGKLDDLNVLMGIQDEIADVTIMLRQLEMIFPDDNLPWRVETKLNRLLTYLPADTEKGDAGK
jgi:Lon protease-like protein